MLPVTVSCSLMVIRKSQPSQLGLVPGSTEKAWHWHGHPLADPQEELELQAQPSYWLCPREEAAPALVPSSWLVKRVTVTSKRQRQFFSRDLHGTEIYTEYCLRTKAYLFRVTSNEVCFRGQCFYSFCDKCHMKSCFKPTSVNFKWHYFHYHNLRLSEQ